MKRRRTENPFSLFAFQDIITAVTGILIMITLILALNISGQPAQTAEQGEPSNPISNADLESIRKQLEQLEKKVKNQDSALQMVSGKSDQQLKDEIKQFEQSQASIRTRIEAQRKLTETAKELLHKLNTENDGQLASQLDEKLKKIEAMLKQLESLQDGSRLVYQVKSSSSKTAWFVDVTDGDLLAAKAGIKQTPVKFSGNSLEERIQAFRNWAQNLKSSERYVILLVRPKGIASYKAIRGLNIPRIEFGVDLISNDVIVIDPVDGASIK